MSQHEKGSSKQIINWLSQRPKDFIDKLDLAIPCVQIEVGNLMMPREKEDWIEARLETIPDDILSFLQKDNSFREDIRSWWLPSKAKGNPVNWDFLCTAIIEGKPGLILAEAKSHKNELKKEGKPLNTQKVVSAEDQLKNHEKIGQAISEAQGGLTCSLDGVNISRDTHYQLSNRVAFLWRLISWNIPVILIYLGFINDLTLDPKKFKLFNGVDNWEKELEEYFKGVFPFPGNNKAIKIDCNKNNISGWVISCMTNLLSGRTEMG